MFFSQHPFVETFLGESLVVLIGITLGIVCYQFAIPCQSKTVIFTHNEKENPSFDRFIRIFGNTPKENPPEYHYRVIITNCF